MTMRCGDNYAVAQCVGLNIVVEEEEMKNRVFRICRMMLRRRLKEMKL